MESNRHEIALNIENYSRKVLKCERGSFNGLIDADNIEVNPVLVLIFVLIKSLNINDDLNRHSQIIYFVNLYSAKVNKTLSDLLIEESQYFMTIVENWKLLIE